MQLNPVTKLDKRNATTSKNSTMTSRKKIMTSSSFRAIRNQNSLHMVYDYYILFHFFNYFYLTKKMKTNLKNSNTALILLTSAKLRGPGTKMYIF